MATNEDFPKLTKGQDNFLVTLMREARALTNSDLAAFGLSVPKSDSNKKLVDHGLIVTDKSSKPFSHQLTDKGRRYVEQIGKPKPPVSREKSGLTSTQVQSLVVLMAEARALNNNDLKELAGFALTGKDNESLESQGLITTDRSQTPFVHELTDRGWRVAREIHASAPPATGGSAIKTLFNVLANLHRSLDRLQISHGEFFKQTAAVPVVTAPATSAPSATANVETMIRDAYAALAPRPGGWVGLADLRERLATVERSEVDAVLRSMARQDGVRIIPVANTKALESRDRAAALRIGEEDNHTLAIGST
jgi:hypothetical protein